MYKALLLVFLTFQTAFALDVLPWKAPVVDDAAVLSPAQEGALNQEILRLQTLCRAQIAVVILQSTRGVPHMDYAHAFLNQHGVGDKEKSNGLVFLTAIKDRFTYVATGYGAESYLPDSMAGRIRDQVIIPQFKAGRFDQGIIDGTRALIHVSAKACGNPELQASTATVGKKLSRPYIKKKRSLFSNILRFIIFGFIVLMFIRNPSLLFWLLLSSSGRGGGFGGGFGGGGGGFGGGFGGSSGGGGAGGSW
jgi:uncharacterized protein